MSGQGAMFTIDNSSAQSVSVQTSGDNMNFIPPSGTVEPGKQQGPLYVEAQYVGSSSFELVLDGSINIPFKLDGWSYLVANGSSYKTVSGDRLITVDITHNGQGNQDVIDVRVIALPKSAAGTLGALIYQVV